LYNIVQLYNIVNTDGTTSALETWSIR